MKIMIDEGIQRIIEQANTLLVDSKNYYNLSRYDESERCVHEALTLLEPYTERNDLGDALDKDSPMYSIIEAMAHSYNRLNNISLALGDHTQALQHGATAIQFCERNGNASRKAGLVVNTAIVQQGLGDFAGALETYMQALAQLNALGNKEDAARATGNIGLVYLYLGDHARALEYFSHAHTEHERLGMKAEAARISVNIGGAYQSLGDYTRALENMSRALVTMEELGNLEGVANVTGNMGSVYALLLDSSNALTYMARALAANETLGNKINAAINTKNIGVLYSKREYEMYDPRTAEELLTKALNYFEESGQKQRVYETHFSLAEMYESCGRDSDAYRHFKKFHKVIFEVQGEKVKKQAEQMEQNRLAAVREKEIAVAKAAADSRHQATQELLHNVLPPSIAHRILEGTKLIAEKLPKVSVLFADIVNFTILSRRTTAEELVVGLDEIFSSFDTLAEKYGLEKIKTIGDAYMVVAGAPEPRADHAEAMAAFALEMVETMNTFTSHAIGEVIQLRIGIHCGEVVAGVIGKKKFAYDLWGDAVNTASRMESHGEPQRIHCTEEFVQAVGESSFLFIPRGEIDIKGKGLMRTYFLEKA